MSSGEKTGPSEPSSVPSGGQSPSRPNDELDGGPSSEGAARKPGRRRRAAAQCQVCRIGLHSERPYYQRYRICPNCSTKDRIGPDGGLQRFCQQCGKFQDVAVFDGTMRTCRERLNRHAARRRKAHARSVAADYNPGADAYLPTGMGVYDSGAVPPGGAAGVLEVAQAVLQRVVGHRNAESARYMTFSHDLRLQYPQGPAAPPPPVLPLRPVDRDLLTPLLKPHPVRFHPPMFAGGSHSHLVDPAAAQARLEAVLASATAAMSARSAEKSPVLQQQRSASPEIEEKGSSELEEAPDASQTLKSAIEWIMQQSAGSGGGQVPAPTTGGTSAGASDLHSALGAALAGILQRQAGHSPGEGGGS